MTQTAFQVDAFQNDAYQIVAVAAGATADSGAWDWHDNQQRSNWRKKKKQEQADLEAWLAGLPGRTAEPPPAPPPLNRRQTVDLTPVPVFDIQPVPDSELPPPVPVTEPPAVVPVQPRRRRKVARPAPIVVLVPDDRKVRILMAAKAYRASRIRKAVLAYQQSKKKRHA